MDAMTAHKRLIVHIEYLDAKYLDAKYLDA